MKNMINRRNFKRKAAFLMALSMVGTLPQAMNAEAAISTISASLGNGRKVVPITKKSSKNAARIDISMDIFVPIKSKVNFTATLKDGNGNVVNEKNFKIGSDEENKTYFDELENGEYILEVTAPGFATYRQNISVLQKLYTVKLTAGFSGQFAYTDGEAHPGVVMLGDVNNDGFVNDEDRRLLVDKIDGKGEDGYTYDLNFDGDIDLKDLVLLSESYKEEDKNIDAKIEETVSPATVETEVPDEVTVQGNLEDVLTGEGSVILSPAVDENGEEVAISEEHPVEVGFDISGSEEAVEIDGISFGTGTENPIEEAFITVTCVDGDGNEYPVTVPVIKGVDHLLEDSDNPLLKESDVRATIDENGNINVHLGAQIAVKKVSLKITALQNKSNNLAEISKVEFVNGMEDRIPEPEMDIPEEVQAVAGSEKFTVSWKACNNVKGYKLEISDGKTTDTINVTNNSATISKVGKSDVKNMTTYTVKVKSVNGSWESPYSEEVSVTPMPTKRPDKPDNVKAAGAYKSIRVSWKKMDDTESYEVYYKVRSEKDDTYKSITGITSNNYTIEDLYNETEYEVYVVGVNALGKSPASIHSAASTTTLSPAEVPKYNMINRDAHGNPGSTHITNVTRIHGTMEDSRLDEGKTNTAWGAVDNNAASYYKFLSWDDGGYNGLGNNGLVYTFDKAYKLGSFAVRATDGMEYSYYKIQYWDANGKAKMVNASREWKTDPKTNKGYYLFTFNEPIEATKLQVGFARYLAGGSYNLITISDTYFYTYDEVLGEIMDLYSDSLHTVLRDGVTQKTIDKLRVKVDTPDKYGEENPNKAALHRELDTAEKILKAEKLSDAVTIHGGITTYDDGRGFSGLNAWQPLGIVASPGETITVYVGHKTKRTGDSTELRLQATQYHSESSNVTLDGANLKIGANVLTFSKANSSVGAESGGAVYVQFQGGNLDEDYSIRVEGGTKVPRLDLYKVTDENERLERTKKFIEALDEYTANMEARHNEIHKGSGNKYVDYDYDKQNCVLGATDILLDTMMISLPAQQMLAGAGKGTTVQRAKNMLDSMTAMEDMMYLFYQHKGLNASAKDNKDRIPRGHLNIRYQRMFAGAFMYASGNHIGIEWGSAPGIMGGVPIKSTEDGKYISGNYFGWGVAHEVGHNINQGAYAVAEITNNYFAQLAQAKDTNEGMRFQYQNIYDKVTSGTKGDCSNIATQLGMYWQLHLAYDNGLNYKTYAKYDEQLANLFYARVDTYARNTGKAPKPGNVALTLSGDSDQQLMRLACASAQKNVLEFFERWGKSPNPDTIAYAEQFEKETRAIFYANDDSRVYALKGGTSVLGTEGKVSAIKDVSVKIGRTANQVELGFTSANIPASDVLGYEIVRCTIEGGKVERVPVGFSTNGKFTDTVTTMNNRVVYYEITLIDHYLNRSAVFTSKSVKIEHDGSIAKDNWSVTTNGLTAPAVEHDATEEMPCEKEIINPADQAIDNNLDTIYAPTVNSNNAEIVIDFHQTLTTTGLKYTAGQGTSIGKYEVHVMTDGEWKRVAEGTFKGSETVYFANTQNEYISTYNATAVKIVLPEQQGKTLSISEIDVLAPTGDNVDFRRTEGDKTTVIGTLGSDYKYGTEEDQIIPKGSVVFTGSYKGNPAYNVVILYDNNGNIVGGTDAEGSLVADQVILADVPDKGNIANVSDGTWIYWIDPATAKELPESVRVELYRVNDAKTNEGQRLVSDSLFENIPEKLPTINFGK
ncbi:MAG: fibronectin type III domain-containing protein [Ruminococcus sp.]|nr:fibronectin type III domain-containing protein [Ruminococcus sp.]